MKNLKDLGKYRPLCHTDHGLLLYRSSKLYLMDYENESIEYLCSLPLDGTKNILASKSRLFERMFRSYARSSIAVNNGALVTYNSGIYYVDFDNITIKREHDFCTGMNNPIGFAEINNIKGLMIVLPTVNIREILQQVLYQYIQETNPVSGVEHTLLKKVRSNIFMQSFLIILEIMF